jgi:hypothetical protein
MMNRSVSIDWLCHIVSWQLLIVIGAETFIYTAFDISSAHKHAVQ